MSQATYLLIVEVFTLTLNNVNYDLLQGTGSRLLLCAITTVAHIHAAIRVIVSFR